jgi:hypothetical protein
MAKSLTGTIVPRDSVKQLVPDETRSRLCRSEIFHSIRGIMAMIGVLLTGTALLNSAGVPRPWQIALSPVWSCAWFGFRKWMLRGCKDGRPAIIPVTCQDIEGAD